MRLPRTFFQFFAIALTLVLVALGVSRVTLTDDASSAMLPVDSSWKSNYERFELKYFGDQAYVVMLRDALCDSEGWGLLVEIDDRLSSLKFVRKVISLASPSVNYVQQTPEQIVVEPFREFEFSSSTDRCEKAKSYAPVGNSLVSKDAQSALVYVFVDASYETNFVVERLEQELNIADPEKQMFVLSGEPFMSHSVSKTVERDSGLLGLLSLLMLVLFYIFSRNWKATLLVAFVILAVLLFSFGTMGLLGITLTPATSLALFLIVPLCCAFCIHAYGYSDREGRLGTNESQQGFLFAGISTALGFAATGITEAADVRNMAVLGVVGIFWTVAIVVLGSRFVSGSFVTKFYLKPALPTWISASNKIALLLFLSLLALILTGFKQLEVNYQPTAYLPHSNDARKDFDLVAERFSTLNIPVVIKVRDVNEVKSWNEVASELQKFTERNSISVAWPYPDLRETARAFESTAVANGLLRLTDDAFEQVLQFVHPDTLDAVDFESNEMLVQFHVPFEGSRDYFVFRDEILERFEANPNVAVTFPGRISAFFETGHRIGADTLFGLGVSGAVVFFVLWWVLRSWLLAAVTVVINALPVGVGLAVLGHLGVGVDMGSSIVAAIAFGIVLDDSAHLVLRVRKLVNAGYDPFTAVYTAVNQLFAPILFTTLAIGIGFAVLYLAELTSFSDFATVMLVTLASALVADLLILPYFVKRLFSDPLR